MANAKPPKTRSGVDRVQPTRYGTLVTINATTIQINTQRHSPRVTLPHIAFRSCQAKSVNRNETLSYCVLRITYYVLRFTLYVSHLTHHVSRFSSLFIPNATPTAT